MFLKTSISTTKKLFQKTLDSVKYLFSGGYQKIPKSPRPCCDDGTGTDTNVSQSYIELDKFYTGFSTHWDRQKKKKKKKNIIIMSSPPAKEDKVRRKRNYHVLEKDYNNQVVDLKKKDIVMYEKKKYQEWRREERSNLVTQKLKELKMLESKDQHALDIEEVLYYYSRLTCPAYVEIVDKFFMEMYSELFYLQQAS